MTQKLTRNYKHTESASSLKRTRTPSTFLTNANTTRPIETPWKDGEEHLREKKLLTSRGPLKTEEGFFNKKQNPVFRSFGATTTSHGGLLFSSEKRKEDWIGLTETTQRTQRKEEMIGSWIGKAEKGFKTFDGRSKDSQTEKNSQVKGKIDSGIVLKKPETKGKIRLISQGTSSQRSSTESRSEKREWMVRNWKEKGDYSKEAYFGREKHARKSSNQRREIIKIREFLRGETQEAESNRTIFDPASQENLKGKESNDDQELFLKQFLPEKILVKKVLRPQDRFENVKRWLDRQKRLSQAKETPDLIWDNLSIRTRHIYRKNGIELPDGRKGQAKKKKINSEETKEGEKEYFQSFELTSQSQVDRLGLTYLTLGEMNEVLLKIKEKSHKKELINAADQNSKDFSKAGGLPMNFEKEFNRHSTGVMKEFVDSLHGENMTLAGNLENNGDHSDEVSLRIFNCINLLRKFFESQTIKNRQNLVKKILDFNSILENVILNEMGSDLNPDLSPKTISAFIKAGGTEDKEALREAELFLAKISNYLVENIQSNLNANSRKFKECYKKLVKAKDDQMANTAKRGEMEKLTGDFSYVQRATKFENSRKDILAEIQTLFKKDKKKKNLLDPLNAHLYSQTKKQFEIWGKVTDRYSMEDE